MHFLKIVEFYADNNHEDIFVHAMRQERSNTMAYSVVSGSYLNSLYGNYRDLASGIKRSSASNTSLVLADSTALKKGASSVTRLSFDNESSTYDGNGKKLFYKKFRAFVDTLNNTLDSSSDSENSDIRKLSKQIKELSKDYKDKLSKYGITIDEKGYWSVKEEIFELTDKEKFEKIIGEDSDFSNAIKKLAKRLNRRINTLV